MMKNNSELSIRRQPLIQLRTTADNCLPKADQVHLNFANLRIILHIHTPDGIKIHIPSKCGNILRFSALSTKNILQFSAAKMEMGEFFMGIWWKNGIKFGGVGCCS